MSPGGTQARAAFAGAGNGHRFKGYDGGLGGPRQLLPHCDYLCSCSHRPANPRLTPPAGLGLCQRRSSRRGDKGDPCDALGRGAPAVPERGATRDTPGGGVPGGQADAVQSAARARQCRAPANAAESPGTTMSPRGWPLHWEARAQPTGQKEGPRVCPGLCPALSRALAPAPGSPIRALDCLRQAANHTPRPQLLRPRAQSRVDQPFPTLRIHGETLRTVYAVLSASLSPSRNKTATRN